MHNRHSACPQCGGRKPLLSACLDCGLVLRHTKISKPISPRLCPRCGARATQNHLSRQTCTPVAALAKPAEAHELPEWGSGKPKTDLFDTRLVFSGGGFGVGKRKGR